MHPFMSIDGMKISLPLISPVETELFPSDANSTRIANNQ